MSESILQITLVSMLRTLYPDFVLNLSLNGISLPVSPKLRSQIIAQCKREGMENGIQDISIYLPESIVLNFELKTDKGKQSNDQIAIQNKLNTLGHNYYIIKDVYTAFAIIAEHTSKEYREDIINQIPIPQENNKLTEQFLHFPKGTDLTEVNKLLMNIYDI